MDFMTG